MDKKCLGIPLPSRPDFLRGDADFYAAPNQIIISGRQNDIATLINLLEGDGYLVKHPDSGTATSTGALWTIDNFFSTVGSPLSEYTIHLYQFEMPGVDDPLNPWVIMQRANDLSVNNGPLFAIAEVNEVIHCLMHTAGGGVHGGPTGEFINVPAGERPDALFFRRQWAFRPDTGINLFDGDNYLHEKVRGEGVHVAIFDSSPLCTGYHETGSQTAGYPFDLCVTSALDDLVNETTSRDEFTEHGYYVASLIHAVAPKSHIHLVQVLDDHVYGSVGFLLSMMDNYIDAFNKMHVDDPDTPLILNLSLGFRLNSIQELDELLQDRADAARAAYEGMRELRRALRRYEKQGLPNELDRLLSPSLPATQIPRFAHPLYFSDLPNRKGKFRHLVVAAAGNEGVRGNPHPEATMPASFESVLGVAAASKNGTRAIFSNRGNVMAPGGDYRLSPPAGDPDSGVGLSDLCASNPTDCPYAIIGRVTTDDLILKLGCELDNKGHKMASGYMLWWGSSFAAPLASGLAALVWSKNPRLSPGAVMDHIKTNQRNGIIDVQKTLDAVPEPPSDPSPRT